MATSTRCLLLCTLPLACLGACTESLELPVAATAGGIASVTAPQARDLTMTIESPNRDPSRFAPDLPLRVRRTTLADGSSSLSVARHASLPSANASNRLIRVVRRADGSLEIVRANGVTEVPRVPSAAFVGRRVGNQVTGRYSAELEAALRVPIRRNGGGLVGPRQLPSRTSISPQGLLDSLVRVSDERRELGDGRIRFLSSMNGYRTTTDFDLALGAVTVVSTVSPAGDEVTVTFSYLSTSTSAVLVARDTRVRAGGKTTVYREHFASAPAAEDVP